MTGRWGRDNGGNVPSRDHTTTSSTAEHPTALNIRAPNQETHRSTGPSDDLPTEEKSKHNVKQQLSRKGGNCRGQVVTSTPVWNAQRAIVLFEEETGEIRPCCHLTAGMKEHQRGTRPKEKNEKSLTRSHTAYKPTCPILLSGSNSWDPSTWETTKIPL
ncbi:583_t:CDS:2 [Acaulospora colombiana]|uniref:583_t:CDS:1 n=1 Tax=Acaulospora colombiana TaxID=27376 RepID=A0ACA9P0M8_9GLOM|nr:583_t:CDS:2 [Acaulospora colombiana]